jgi:hypothetical protein
MTNWLNNDGLYIKFGPSEADPTKGGSYKTLGDVRETEVRLVLKDLTSSAAIIADTTVIPEGAFIEEVTLEVEVAAAGSSSTLSVGLIKTDRTTNISDTALVAAQTLATIDAAGNRVTLIGESGTAGTKVATTLADSGLVTAKYGTAAFTDGIVRVRVKYYFTA